jgi:putative transcriptional regulator
LKAAQQELADLVGVTRQTLNRSKRRYSPTLELAFRIAEVFEKRVDKVFWNEKA